MLVEICNETIVYKTDRELESPKPQYHMATKNYAIKTSEDSIFYYVENIPIKDSDRSI